MIYLVIYLIGVVAAFLLIALINDVGDKKDDISAVASFLSVLFLIILFVGILSEYKPSFKKLFKRNKQ